MLDWQRGWYQEALPSEEAFQHVPFRSSHYYMGWYEWLIGKHPQAVKSWRAGLEAAQKFRMRYEEGLIHMKLGMAYADQAELRKDHFDQAIRIFGEMDAIPMLRHVRELSDQK